MVGNPTTEEGLFTHLTDSCMKGTKKLEALDANVTTFMVLILLFLHKFIEHIVALIGRYVTVSVFGVNITMVALFGLFLTASISIWVLHEADT